MKAFLFACLIAILAPFAYSQAPAAAPPQAAAVALPQGVEKITSVEGITEYRLQNGLRVLLFPDPTKQTITVNITYLVGSLNENYGETGMAHLLEHMVFRGTPKHANIRETFTQRGARNNGSTWLDRTNYYETFAATGDNLDWALDLEADRMVNSFIAKKDLDSEMTVVRNEYESGENDPFRVLMERMQATAYLWHNYGNTTIGDRADIENVPIERLQAFYHMYYQPDNAVLLVAGKIEEAGTLALVQKYFGVIPKPARVLPKFYTEEPVQDGDRAVTLRRTGDVKLVGAVYHVPAGSHPDFAAIDILSFILADTPSGRLYKALVETKKASSISAYNFQQREPGLALFAAETSRDAAIDPVRDPFLQTIEKFSTTPATKEEVERARTALLKEVDLTLNASDRIGLELSEWMAIGDWRLFFLHRDQLKKVTPEDVTRVASAYLKESNRTLGEFIPTEKPDRAQIPATPDINAELKDYKGDAAIAAGEAFDPSPSNIESRTVRSTAGALKLALLSKKTRGETVVARLNFNFGDEKSLAGRVTAAEMAGEMLMRGTAKHTRQQLQDEFDRLKARVSVSGTATGANASIETIRANLPEVLKLVAEVLQQPSFPSSEFEVLKEEALASIDETRSEPNAIAGIEFQRHLNPYPKDDVRYNETFDEEAASTKAITLPEVQKFYKDFYGASSGEVAIVGDFDADATTKLLSDLFGNWKSPAPYTRIPDPYQEVAAVNQSFPAPDKANAFFIAGMNLKLRDDDPDYPALVLGNYMLGGANNARLKVRIREKEGLSYGVGSQINASAQDVSGAFTAFAIYAPQNVTKLEAAFKEEIAKMVQDGFTVEELNLAKQGYKQAREISRAQDAELSRRLAYYLFLDRTLKWDIDFEARVAALTPEQVSAAMKKFVDYSKMTIMKAGDFK